MTACPRWVVSSLETEEAGRACVRLINVSVKACVTGVVYACKTCFQKLEWIEKQW